jgi:hypothetical protein
MALSKNQKEILTHLRMLWEKYPNERLGQILENFIFFEGKRGDKTSVKLFYQEDKRTLALLKLLVGKQTKKQ